MKNKKLLFSVTKKDFEFSYFCAGGPGGQHQNKTFSACRIVHKASGAIGEGREYRSQVQNKKAAFNRLVNTTKFKNWIKIEAGRHLGKETPEEYAEREIKNINNIKIEVRENNKWRGSSLDEVLSD